MEFVVNGKPKYKNIDEDIFKSIKDRIDMGITVSDSDIKIFFEHEIDKCRNILGNYLNVDICNDPLSNRCDLSQRIVGKVFEKDNIEVYPKETQDVIHPNCTGHSFSIVKLQDKYYLIDLTIRQFFDKDKCSIDNLVIKDDKALLAPFPGFFFTRSKEGTDLSNKLIEDGYFELNKDNVGIYANAFYYTKVGVMDYTDLGANLFYKLFTAPNKKYIQTEEQFNELYGKVM